MNYYMPYGITPYIEGTRNVGLLSRIFKNGINWSTILSNTQKTLNIVNQTIPVIKQMGPVMNNAKTMFKLMNEFKKVEPTEPKQNKKNNIIKQNTIEKNIEPTTIKHTNTPTFFQ